MANPNPSPETRFGKGNKANPQGKTGEQRRLEIQNAERAMRIRAKLLEAAERKLGDIESDDAAMEFIEAAMLKLIKDSEDRGLGQPVQPTDHTSSDGSIKFVVDLVGKRDADRDEG